MTVPLPSPPPGATIVTLTKPPKPAGQLLRAVIPHRRPAALPHLVVQLPPTLVDGHRLARYQGVCGFPLRDPVPITYPHVLAFPAQLCLMSEHPFPLPLLGMVHLENELSLLRPVAAGDRLTVRAWAADLRSHAKGRLVDLHGIVEKEGEPVWAGTSTYLSRAARTDATDPEPGPVPAAGHDRGAPPKGAVSAKWRIPSDQGRRYAAVSGDANPIHLTPLAARAFGLKHVIAHGMWTHARSVAALGPLVPELARARVWFHRPVNLPSTVDARVTRAEPGWQVDLSQPGTERLLVRTVVRPIP